MKVNDVSKLLGMPDSTIRYYERQHCLLSERSANNYRDFDICDVIDLHYISSCHRLGLSLSKTKECMEKGESFFENIDEYLADYQRQIEELQSKIERIKVLRSYSLLGKLNEAFILEEVGAMYNLWDYSKGEVNKSCQDSKKLFECIPYSYMALKISKEEVAKGLIENIDFGIGIMESYYHKFNLDIRLAEKRESGKAVYMEFECIDPSLISTDDLKPMIVYMKEHELEARSYYLAHIYLSSREKGQHLYRVGISVLV